jgi:hypothetical protein
MSKNYNRLHPAYVELVSRLEPRGSSLTETLDALDEQQGQALGLRLAAYQAEGKPFEIVVYELMLMPAELAERARAAYPEDQYPEYNLRKHTVHLIRQNVTGGGAAAAEARESFAVEWVAQSYKDGAFQKRIFDPAQAGRLVMQLVNRPTNGFFLAASVLVDVMDRGNLVRLRKSALSGEEQAQLDAVMEQLKALQTVRDGGSTESRPQQEQRLAGQRTVMVEKLLILNSWIARTVQENDISRSQWRQLMADAFRGSIEDGSLHDQIRRATLGVHFAEPV